MPGSVPGPALAPIRGMLYAAIPVIVLVAGLLCWALASNAIVKDAGRYLFIIGAAVTVWLAGHGSMRLP